MDEVIKKNDGTLPSTEAKIRFEPVPGARILRIAHGEYAREFTGPPPYEATADEWEKYLKPTGQFKEVGSVR